MTRRRYFPETASTCWPEPLDLPGFPQRHHASFAAADVDEIRLPVKHAVDGLKRLDNLFRDIPDRITNLALLTMSWIWCGCQLTWTDDMRKI
jgi:hypothetical protein